MQFLSITYTGFSQTAPNFTITSSNGETLTLYDALDTGNVVMLDFFFVNGNDPNILNVFPNPATDNATFVFNLTESSEVNIELYNILGRKVKTVLTESLNAGDHNESVDLTDLSVGQYFARISIDGELADVVKLTHLK